MRHFAALQSRANASVLQHLANARVLIGGVAVDGIFTNPAQVVALGRGAADTRPSVSVDSSAVPDDPVDSSIEVDGVPYQIVGVSPDGSGLTVLSLECTQ